MSENSPFAYLLPAAAVGEKIRSLGPAKESFPIFDAKAEIIPIALQSVRAPAANIIKQEMLCVGGDAVTPFGCINCSIERGEILLLGTSKHYRRVIEKFAAMKYFGLEKIAAEIAALLKPTQLLTKLANGRVITYEKKLVMGIINLTDDSLYANSRVALDEAKIIAAAGRMFEDGAAIIDFGAESTRPGAEPIDAAAEKERLSLAVRAVKKHYPQAIISVDTYRAASAEAAIECGADMINDISAAENDSSMLETVKKYDVPIVIMHKRGDAQTMQNAANTAYADVTAEVVHYLKNRADYLSSCGIGKEKIIIDPGFGFAKTTAQNLRLLRDLKAFTSIGCPVLAGASRKSFIGEALGGLPPAERLSGTIAVNCQAVLNGANIVRVHDVKENVQAIKMIEDINNV